MILYRPLSLQELALIYDSGMKSFPASLPQQPIFYPVLDLEYARQTASGWNAKNGELAGYVTEFKVEDSYIGKFKKHKVGETQYKELWIPAEEMEKFNQHILGHIRVVEAHFGEAFEGFIPEAFALQGKNAVEQFTLLANSFLYKRMEFYLEIKRNHKAVFLNYPFWQIYEFKNPGLKEKIIQAIKEAWLTSFPKIPLPLPAPVVEETPPTPQVVVKPTQKHRTERKQPRPPARRLVDPEEEEIDTPTNFVVEPIDEEEDIAPVEHIPTPRFVEPVQEEFTPIEQAYLPSNAPVHFVEEETLLEEEEDLESTSAFDPSYEPVKSVERASLEALPESIDEEDDALDEDLDPLEDEEEEEDFLLFEQTDAPSVASPVREEIEPAEPRDPQPFVPPVHRESKPPEPTVSPVWVHRAPRDTTPPRQADSHLMQGIKLGLSGNYLETIDELSRAVEEDPEHVAAHVSLGVAFQRSGEEDRALACYETALRIDPNDAEAHYFRANILYDQGNMREAIAGYTRAVGLQPALINATENPAPQDRLTDYRRAPAEMPWIAKPARHILALNKVLETHPSQGNLFKERAAQYARLWNYQQAVADYTTSLERQPRDARVLHARGTAYEQLGQHERALEDYQQAIAINPQLSDVYIHRGVTFGRMRNFRQSVASLTEGIRLAPQNPDGYFNRGTSYFQLGDFEKAIADFSSVLRLSPRDESAFYWRGISHEQAGRRREAIADYRQFLTISQDPRARREIEQKLIQWGAANRQTTNRPIAAPPERPAPNPVSSRERNQPRELHGLIAALGERALHSTWFGIGVECQGETAEKLHALSRQEKPILGRDLLPILSGIHKTVRGSFQAFDKGVQAPWIIIRAWEGNGFYLETNDPQSVERLKARFPSLEDVEGASPPYESLFITADEMPRRAT